MRGGDGDVCGLGMLVYVRSEGWYAWVGNGGECGMVVCVGRAGLCVCGGNGGVAHATWHHSSHLSQEQQQLLSALRATF